MKTDVKRCGYYLHPSVKMVQLGARSVLCLSGENSEAYVIGAEEGVWEDDSINE